MANVTLRLESFGHEDLELRLEEEGLRSRTIKNVLDVFLNHNYSNRTDNIVAEVLKRKIAGSIYYYVSARKLNEDGSDFCLANLDDKAEGYFFDYEGSKRVDLAISFLSSF